MVSLQMDRQEDWEGGKRQKACLVGDPGLRVYPQKPTVIQQSAVRRRAVGDKHAERVLVEKRRDAPAAQITKIGTGPVCAIWATIGDVARDVGG